MEALRIRIPAETWDGEFAGLARDADVAARAAAMIEVPAAKDFRRYNDLAALIEVRAVAYARANPKAVTHEDLVVGDEQQRHSWEPTGDSSAHVVTVCARLRADTSGHVVGDIPEPLKAVPRGRFEAKASELRLRRAEHGDPLVAGNFTPDDLAEGLQRLARSGEGRPPGTVRILYLDTSESAPFPLARLRMEDDGRSMTVLKVSLMSGRHQEMDGNMHGTWFRNNELSGAAETGADTDAIAYRLSKRHLLAIASPESPVEIELHVTGLEPAIVGFFRAVAEHLEHNPGSLRVRPRYFRGRGENDEDAYEDGAVWTNR